MIIAKSSVLILLTAVNILVVFNPYIAKPRAVMELANNKLFKLFAIFISYFVASYYSVIAAMQLCAGVLFLDFDYDSVVAKYLSL